MIIVYVIVSVIRWEECSVFYILHCTYVICTLLYMCCTNENGVFAIYDSGQTTATITLGDFTVDHLFIVVHKIAC